MRYPNQKITPPSLIHSVSLTIAAVALGLGGCTPTSPSSTSSDAVDSPTASSPTAAELQVVTTFLPITQFTKAVAGERAEVSQLLPTKYWPTRLSGQT
jgi:zinc transport system substrate-binding protein